LCQIPHKSYFIPAASQTLGTDAFHGNPLLPASHKYRRCQNNRAAALRRTESASQRKTLHRKFIVTSLYLFGRDTSAAHWRVQTQPGDQPLPPGQRLQPGVRLQRPHLRQRAARALPQGRQPGARGAPRWRLHRAGGREDRRPRRRLQNGHAQVRVESHLRRRQRHLHQRLHLPLRRQENS